MHISNRKKKTGGSLEVFVLSVLVSAVMRMGMVYDALNKAHKMG